MATIQRLWSTKRRFRILAAIFGVALIYLLPFLAMPGFAAIYLKIDGIEGESTSKAFPKMIELDSVKWGSGRAISSPIPGKTVRDVSPASVSEITLTKRMDKTSLPLFKEAVAGQTGKAATIYFSSTSDGAELGYYEITLSDVLVSSFAQSSQSSDRPSESLSLNFTKVALKYSPIGADGKLGTAITTSYDLTTGKTQ